MKTYRGGFEGGHFKVYVEDSGPTRRELDPRLDLYWMSARGEFAWGYNCSETNQLAFALLMDALDGDVERARAIYLVFKRASGLLVLDPGQEWTLTLAEVLDRVTAIEEVVLAMATRGPSDSIPF